MTLSEVRSPQEEAHLLSASNHGLSRPSVSFDETNLAPNAGLLPAAVLAQRIDLAGLVDCRRKLARHGANSGAKALDEVAQPSTSSRAGCGAARDLVIVRVAHARRVSACREGVWFDPCGR